MTEEFSKQRHPENSDKNAQTPIAYHPDLRGTSIPENIKTGLSHRHRILITASIALVLVGMAGLVSGGSIALSGLILVFGLAMAVFAWFLPSPFFPVFRYDIPQLNNPPVEEPPILIGEHGTVHRGHTDVPLDTTNDRPYIWIWLEPPLRPGCSYRWYQFVRPTIFIDGQRRDSTREFTAATGLKVKYDTWNPDYHTSEVLESDPGFVPDGLQLDPDTPGKPYKHYHVPGTRLPGSTTSVLTGILDAPNFCVRTDTMQSEVELMVEGRIPDEDQVVVQATAPSDQTVNVVIAVEVRSYLVCIDRENNVECIGFVEWTYNNTAVVLLTWVQAGIELGSHPRWTLSSELSRCTYSYTFGGWTAC